MLSKTDWLMEKQIALSALTKTGLLKRSPSVSMNEDEEADAHYLASEVETDRTGQKIRRDLAKFRRRLLERVQPLLGHKKIQTFTSHISFKIIVITYEDNWPCLRIFYPGKFAGGLLVKNIAESLFKSRNSTSGNTHREGCRF